MGGSRIARAEIAGTLGALALLVGAFAPAARVGLYGEVTWSDAFEGPGTVLVVAAAASLFGRIRDTVAQDASRRVSDAILSISELSWGPWLLLAGCLFLGAAALRTRGPGRARR